MAKPSITYCEPDTNVGHAAFCLATGPSLTLEDVERVKQWRAAGNGFVIAVNDNYRIAPWADYLYACDRRWWEHHYDAVRKTFTGKLWTQHKCWEGGLLPGINVIASQKADGLSTNRLVIHSGINSGYQAINLAMHKGAKTIYLLGYDMDGRGDHWFGKHEGAGLCRHNDYSTLVPKFDTIRPADYGITIINCTRKSRLNFPRQNLEAVTG